MFGGKETMRRLSTFVLVVLSVVILSACAGQPTAAPTAQPTATTLPFIGLIATATSTPNPLPAETVLPTALPTAVTYQVIRATINIDALYMREGPGFLFDQLDVYPKGQKVDVIAQEPDGDWVFVQTGDFMSGWMNTNYLDLQGSLSSVPAIIPVGLIMIKGHVYMAGHAPATRIGVAILPAESEDTALQDVANTNERGEWYIFLPPSFEGSWTIAPNAYSPESSAVNAAGNLIGTFPAPQTVSVPVPADTWIDFYLMP